MSEWSVHDESLRLLLQQLSSRLVEVVLVPDSWREMLGLLVIAMIFFKSDYASGSRTAHGRKSERIAKPAPQSNESAGLGVSQVALIEGGWAGTSTCSCIDSQRSVPAEGKLSVYIFATRTRVKPCPPNGTLAKRWDSPTDF